MPRSDFEEKYFEDPHYPPGLKGGDEVSGYGYYPDYFGIVEAQLASLAQITAARTLLDVGCGKAALAEYARVELGLATAAVDLSSYAVRQARRRRGGEWTVRAAVTALPFATRSFDVVWCNGVLQYLDAVQARTALSEIARVCRRAAFVSNIAAAQRYSDWGREDALTRLYLKPAQWEGIARGCGLHALAVPFEGESAILIAPASIPARDAARLALRFVDLSLERMQRLGALRRYPPALDAFHRRLERST